MNSMSGIASVESVVDVDVVDVDVDDVDDGGGGEDEGNT